MSTTSPCCHSTRTCEDSAMESARSRYSLSMTVPSPYRGGGWYDPSSPRYGGLVAPWCLLRPQALVRFPNQVVRPVGSCFLMTADVSDYLGHSFHHTAKR